MKNVSNKTITEVIDGDLSIHCFADLKEDGSTNPAIYFSEIIEIDKQINKLDSIDGELVMLSEDSAAFGLNESGELLYDLQNPDENSYSIVDGNLIYSDQTIVT